MSFMSLKTDEEALAAFEWSLTGANVPGGTVETSAVTSDVVSSEEDEEEEGFDEEGFGNCGGRMLSGVGREHGMNVRYRGRNGNTRDYHQRWIDGEHCVAGWIWHRSFDDEKCHGGMVDWV